MKKIIIASLVGGILLFGWQGLSWMVLNLHAKAYLYTPAQDSLLSHINSSLTEEGQYVLPGMPPGASQKDAEAIWKNQEGKPWASIVYHKAFKMNMTMQMIRGFLICLVCVWLFCLVVGRIGNKSFSAVFSTALTFGIISFLFVWYIGHNWIDTPWSVLKAELIDDLAGWGLVGIWLGWWYGRK
jgi:hypothetical protein